MRTILCAVFCLIAAIAQAGDTGQANKATCDQIVDSFGFTELKVSGWKADPDTLPKMAPIPISEAAHYRPPSLLDMDLFFEQCDVGSFVEDPALYQFRNGVVGLQSTVNVWADDWDDVSIEFEPPDGWGIGSIQAFRPSIPGASQCRLYFAGKDRQLFVMNGCGSCASLPAKETFELLVRMYRYKDAIEILEGRHRTSMVPPISAEKPVDISSVLREKHVAKFERELAEIRAGLVRTLSGQRLTAENSATAVKIQQALEHLQSE